MPKTKRTIKVDPVAQVRAIAQLVKPTGMSTGEMDQKVAEALAAVKEPTKQAGEEREFRPCADCRAPITCEESGEDRCP